MVDEKIVQAHYQHGALLSSIENALDKMGISTTDITIADLAPIDEFHIGGRAATEHLMGELKFSGTDKLLDIGCGLGGAARFVASTYGNHVSGVDLTSEYIATGKVLNEWLGLEHAVALNQCSALDLPFDAQAFEGAYMLHVGMNIEAKSRLFSEVARVLKPGASFGVYDVMRSADGELTYPVPWASEPYFSYLATPDQYCQLLESAGFEVTMVNDRREFAVDFFANLKRITQSNDGPPPLGLHVLMQDTAAIKIQNMVGNISRGTISPVEIVAKKND